ncbi:UNC93-like protein MFSD11 isoform X3 [Aphis gossypii]|uniref:UNC93-like protein MFSD11 isoform X3 n=1 Tax=Aphis gossypii TaxID=80765 RepID=UPI0021599547|nr:UNC93-like protein MFSD11 isoform X3 [Aphis gossypii]
MDKRLYNISLLGLSFTFLFAAYQSMGNIEKTLLRSVQNDYPSFTGDGYTSLSISYFVFGLANWISPSVVNLTGCKIAMIIGAICYTMLLGNAFVFYALQDKNDFDVSTRRFIYTVLIATSVFGTLLFLLLRSPVNLEGTVNERVETISFIQQIKYTKSLFLTKDMRLLNVTFFFTGLHLSFYAGVYSSSIGFTERMGSNRKQLVGLSGLLIGCGEILGGLLFGIFGQKTFDNNTTSKGLSHSAVIALGFIINIVAYGLIFINLPDDSPFGDTIAKSFINPNQSLAMFCGFLLGFGDSCINTQLYNIIGLKYSENSAPPMALYNFVQSIAAAASFYYSNYFGIYVQLILLMVSLTMGTLSFFKVEESTDKRYYEAL